MHDTGRVSIKVQAVKFSPPLLELKQSSQQWIGNEKPGWNRRQKYHCCVIVVWYVNHRVNYSLHYSLHIHLHYSANYSLHTRGVRLRFFK